MHYSFMKAIIEQTELEHKVEINRENLLKLKEICLQASTLPWNYDETYNCQRIFNNPIQKYKDENGEECKFLGHGLQLAKIPKNGTPYAEYWFDEKDLKFIMESSKWMLPLIDELLKQYPEIKG